MKRLIPLAALLLALAAGCGPKELPMDQFALGMTTGTTVPYRDAQGEEQALPLARLEVEIPLEIPLTLPQVKDLTVEAASGAPQVQARVLGDRLTLTGTGEVQEVLVTLTLSAPGYNPQDARLLATVALHPMELTILGPIETEDVLLDNPLLLTDMDKGQQVILPLSAPQGADLSVQVEGSAVTAAIEGETLVLTVAEEGEASLLVDAALALHQPAQAQLTVQVALKPPPAPVTPAANPNQGGTAGQSGQAGQQGPAAPSRGLNQQPSTDWADTSAYSQTAQEIVTLVNEERAAQGLPALTQLSGVNILAAVRAREAAESWSHQRPDGRAFTTVFDDNAMVYAHLGENLHAGNYATADNGTAAAVVDAFMNSPGHRENILRPAFTGIGVGVYYDGSEYFFCQLFVAP